MAHEDVRYYRGQELRAAEEDSTHSFICVLKKMKEVRLMEKVVEDTEEAFTERMESLAEQWRELHARRAQLKAHVVTSGATVKAFTERMESLAEQWRELHARRAQLKAHVVTSGATVKENERLRSQALKKAKEEKEENSKKETELVRARRELEALRKQHQKLSKKLLQYSRFRRYLEEVVEHSQFHDIDDIITYYKALLRTRKDLLQSQWWHRQLLEQGKGLQQQIRAEREAEMLQCRNELVQLKESLEQAQSDIRHWEQRCAQVQDGAARRAVELRSLTMAIHSLFHAASARLQPQGRVAAGDSHRQLDMIRQFIHDLQDFTEDMKERGRAL
ncbi:coiled-coil domain-containing protein 42 [Passer montanus]|uniref:coiled-coil domain-containing protein 42 n=1 Tax=Passer montanus TaxID=9160 RepID=UPI00195F6FDC|nr:coiled-coil domain-containing protein 42 [Passer montanus]